MKLLISALLLFPSMCFSQKKRDNTIVIPYKVSIEKIKSILFKNSYNLDGNVSLFFITQGKSLSTSAVEIKLMFHRTDSATYIKGIFKSQVKISLFGKIPADNDFQEIFFGGMKRSQLRESWIEVDRIAKLIGLPVLYIKE